MPSLLKLAKEVQKTRRCRVSPKGDRVHVTRQEKNLVLAWLKGDIGHTEVNIVTNRAGHNAYSRAFVVLRKMLKEGKIIIAKK